MIDTLVKALEKVEMAGEVARTPHDEASAQQIDKPKLHQSTDIIEPDDTESTSDAGDADDEASNLVPVPMIPGSAPVYRGPANTPMKATATPFRPSTATPTVAHASFGDVDTSFVNTASTFSTPAEIMLGPQSLPYIFHQRASTNTGDVSPTKGAYINPKQRNISSPALIQLSFEEHDELNDNLFDRFEAATPVVPQPAPMPKAKPELCSWRKEQIKNLKTPRLINGGKVTFMSSLHGPLSLPYARNPSGVDATIADDSAYMSHIFGLKALPNVIDVQRNVSGGTDSSRSTSNSSVIYVGQKAKDGHQAAAEAADLMVVRDPHQQIGMRRKLNQTEQPYAQDSRQILGELPPALLPTTQPLRINSDKSKKATHPVIPSTALFDPALAHLVPSALSPIPGSPAVAEFDPFKQLFEGMLQTVTDPDHHEALDQATIARLLSTAQYRGPTSSSAYPVHAPASRVVSAESAHHDHTSPGRIHGSKADSSDDWRSKMKKSASFADLPPAVVNPSPAKLSAATNYSPPSSREVMTINDLLERFGTPEQNTVKFRPPIVQNPVEKGTPTRSSTSKPTVKSLLAEPDTKKTTSPTGTQAATTSKTPRPSQILGAARTVSAKGTPGAGKLLRKSSGAEFVELSRPSSKLAVVEEKENAREN